MTPSYVRPPEALLKGLDKKAAGFILNLDPEPK
jgi:hypothetical protein